MTKSRHCELHHHEAASLAVRPSLISSLVLPDQKPSQACAGLAMAQLMHVCHA